MGPSLTMVRLANHQGESKDAINLATHKKSVWSVSVPRLVSEVLGNLLIALGVVCLPDSI